jgi:hypothetical protein
VGVRRLLSYLGRVDEDLENSRVLDARRSKGGSTPSAILQAHGDGAPVCDDETAVDLSPNPSQ